MTESTFDLLPDPLPALVASAASPAHFDPVVDVGAAPINVPSKRLSAALAADDYRLARSVTMSSPGDWSLVAEFLESDCGGMLFEARQPSAAAAHAKTGDAMIVAEWANLYRPEFTFTVAANRVDVAGRWLAALAALLPDFPPPPPPPERPHDVIPVRFWMQDPYSKEAYSRHRDITVTDWADIEGNYPADARSRLAGLAGLSEPAGGKLILLHGPPGTGKAQPHDAKVLTPTGWSTMGDIAPGDQVCTPDGGRATVQAKYPQGEVPIYRVGFSDGSSTRCCGAHLWRYQTRQDRQANSFRNDRVASLHDLTGRLHTTGGQRNVWIPITEPVEFDGTDDLPVDPYVVGVMIGDGYLRTRTDVSFSKPDEWVANEVARLTGVDALKLRSQGRDRERCATWDVGHIGEAMSDLGLVGKRSTEKFIPSQYLMASVKDRWSLLAGLLDTDGYAYEHDLEWSTSSSQLADDFAFLVESLGCTYARSERIPHYSYEGERREGAMSYRFHVCPPVGVNPLRIPRKRDMFNPRSKYGPRRAMVSIQPDGFEEASCILVDSTDHLYITDDFIVTHNTRSILALLSEWRDWCTASVVTDTDRFFGDPTYINSLVFNSVGMHNWMVLVLEDADDYIAVGGREKKGQSISRLLNLADGIVGQGINLLTLMTTNVDVDELNPAVTRNGRCMANVEVGPFPADEAAVWLSGRGVDAAPDGPLTLADMYALASGS